MAESGGFSPARDIERAKTRLESEGKEDRISDLPDVIIQHILSFLPSTEEAIRTGILSKRWRNQWTRVPVLIFYSSGWYNDDFSELIEKTLALHDCPKMKKFHIQYDYLKELKLHQKVNFAASKYLHELILQCPSSRDADEFKLPKSIINNTFLVKLELINCHLNTKWKPDWPCLKELKLNSPTLRFTALQKAVFGSPLLESLELANCSAVYGHVLVSISLKRLSFVDVECDDNTKHLGISCPNLEELSVTASEFVCTYLNRKTIESALSSCSLLRYLELRGVFYDELVIESQSLKKIVLQENDKRCAIEIFCPNLEELNLDSLEIGSLKVVNLPSCVGVDRDVMVSKSIKRMSIVDVEFDDGDDDVKILWPHLDEFSIRASVLVSPMSSQAIEYLLAGSQLLRSLELRNFWNDELVIASNSLKKLVLQENYGCCAVEFSCPNLEELCLYALAIDSLKVLNLPSSVSATVNLDFWDLDENAIKQIYEQFQHVKKLKFEK